MPTDTHPVPASMLEAIQRTAAARQPAREALAAAELLDDNLRSRLSVVESRLHQARLGTSTKLAELHVAADRAIASGDDAGGLAKLKQADQLKAGMANDHRLEESLRRQLDESATALRQCDSALRRACDAHKQAVEAAEGVYVSKMPLYQREWPAFVSRYPRPALIAEATWLETAKA